MDWAQLSLRQPCGWEAGISALRGKAAAEGGGGTAGTASGDRVLLPTGDAVLPVALNPPPQARPLVPIQPGRRGGKAGSAPRERERQGRDPRARRTRVDALRKNGRKRLMGEGGARLYPSVSQGGRGYVEKGARRVPKQKPPSPLPTPPGAPAPFYGCPAPAHPRGGPQENAVPGGD